jgi:hypothetical protein
VLSFGGKGIVMRPDALRETTARAARASGHKLATRLSPGEKGGRKRMAEIGAVYDATPVPRAAGDIISSPGGGRAGPARPDDKGAAPRAGGPREVADRQRHQRHPGGDRSGLRGGGAPGP